MLEIEYKNNLALKYKFNDCLVNTIGHHCTMELTTDLCKLPFSSKRTFGKKYKWPKLEEALSILLNEKLEGAHDSLNDVRTTIKLLKYLVNNSILKIPNHSLV